MLRRKAADRPSCTHYEGKVLQSIGFDNLSIDQAFRNWAWAGYSRGIGSFSTHTTIKLIATIRTKTSTPSDSYQNLSQIGR